MRCTHPVQTRDKLGRWVDRPCGQCIACRLNKARDWSIRCMNEFVTSKKACFLTLTYDDEHLPVDKSIHKKVFQDWMKRFRKSSSLKIRFYACGEYGSQTFRPHYHVIVFNMACDDDVFLNRRYDYKKHGYWCRLDSWSNGNCFVADVDYGVADYVTKYTMKKQTGKKGKEYYSSLGIQPEFALMSQGIGRDYCDQNAMTLRNLKKLRAKTGYAPLPRYYVGRLFQGSLHGQYEIDKLKWLSQKKAEFEDIAKSHGVDSEEWQRQTSISDDAELGSMLKLKGKRDAV